MKFYFKIVNEEKNKKKSMTTVRSNLSPSLYKMYKITSCGRKIVSVERKERRKQTEKNKKEKKEKESKRRNENTLTMDVF